jgi:hypothetical protein
MHFHPLGTVSYNNSILKNILELMSLRHEVWCHGFETYISFLELLCTKLEVKLFLNNMNMLCLEPKKEEKKFIEGEGLKKDESYIGERMMV